MFVDESLWIRKKLSAAHLPEGTEVINIGSSDENFLRTQPYISENVMAPLKDRGCRITDLDIRVTGPDGYSADISEKGLTGRVAKRFGLVLCTSLLEHVADRESALDNIAALPGAGGYLLLTVPRKYPFHPDPLDTMYRPSPEELIKELTRRRDFSVEAAEELDIRHPRHYYFESRFPLWGYRKFIFWRRWFGWSRWKMTCLLLRARPS